MPKYEVDRVLIEDLREVLLGLQRIHEELERNNTGEARQLLETAGNMLGRVINNCRPA